MHLRHLVLPLVATALVAPLAASALAGSGSGTPVFRTYTSPVGVALSTGDLPPEVTDPAPFGIYQQTGIGDSCGEPSLGVDPKTGNVLYECGLQTLLVSDFDKGGAGRASWKPVQPLVEGEQSSDPILWRDTDTGRVFVNQLMPQGCSVQAYSDDFGKTWMQSLLGCAAGISFDHQTVTTGRPTVLPANPAYQNLVYYCTNDLVTLNCGTSVDGGLTYGPSHPVFTDPAETCSPIVGHVKTAPDGTVYVMPDGCDDEAGKQAVFASGDNGLTWTKRSIGRSSQGDAGHPSVGVGSDGTVYAAYGSADNDGRSGRVQVAVSTSKGVRWTTPAALGKDAGVKVSRFPLVVAGDGDRAAVAYLGSKSTDNPASKKSFTGAWHMYVSYTYDRGRTWKTVDATPGSPVQVGSICTGGLACDGDRNLLDFNGMVLDGKGYPVLAYADGCLKVKGCTGADRLKKGALSRQTGGKGLYKRFDR